MALIYIILFVCLLVILLAVNSKKLFLFVFLANVIAGDFLYLSRTLYALPLQQELSFAFTGISLLIVGVMFLKNKPHFPLPKRVYNTFILFLGFFIISVVVNYTSISLAVWSFVNVFKYLFVFFVLSTIDLGDITSKITKIVIGIVIFEFFVGLYSFLFYARGVPLLEGLNAVEIAVRPIGKTFFGDRVFTTTLGSHNILGLVFSLLVVYLYEKKELYEVDSKYYEIAFIMALLTVFVFVSGKMPKLMVLLAFVILWGRKIRSQSRMILPFALALIVALTWLYFYEANLRLSAYSGLAVALNPIRYIITSLSVGKLRPATYYAAFLVLWQSGKLFFGFGPGMSGSFLDKFEYGKETFEQLFGNTGYEYKGGLGNLLDSQYVDLGLQTGLVPIFFFVFFLLSIGFYCKKKGNIFPLVYITMFLLSGVSHACWGLRSYSMIFWTVLALSVNRTLKKERNFA